jgi:hypothetical protein
MFLIRSNDISEGEICREAHPSLAARPRGANIGTKDLAADGERRGGESAPEARGMERPAPLPQRVAAGSNTPAPAGRGQAAMVPPPPTSHAPKRQLVAANAPRNASAQSAIARRAVLISRP